MGNSLASRGVRPDIVEKDLSRKQTVWSISQFGDQVSIDYFNLQRIVATCRKCPKKIIYVASERSFGKENATSGPLYDNLERLYIDTDEENEILKEAAKYDPSYEDVYNTMRLKKFFPLYLLRRQLTGMVKKNLLI